MNDVAEFLAYAIKLEEDAAARFSDLAESMKTYGNREVAEFLARWPISRACIWQKPASAPVSTRCRT
jgi:hypothetical protein